MADKLTIDCSTGEAVIVPLTVEEQADRDRLATQEASRLATLASEDQNRSTIRTQVEAHMTDLAAITGSTGTLTAAQLSNAVRVLAQGQRRLIRLSVGLLNGTD